MIAYVALLRAINVGGTGKLPMSDLKAMCDAAGFEQVRTYIASGNVVFASKLPEATIKKALEERLQDYAGKPVGVAVRTGVEMAAVMKANPFPDAAANRTVAIFLDAAPATDMLDHMRGRADEVVLLGRREIYVHYPGGQGRSMLKIPAAARGTARNLNTVAKLAEMAAAL